MKKIIKYLVSLIVLIILFTLIINIVVVVKTKRNIKEGNYMDFEYAIVLGAKVTNNLPSLMLKDRLDKALEIYKQNNNIKIILSGDSVDEKKYDEVGVMEKYLIENGVPINNIILDKYGINTHDSIIRCKEIVKDKNVLIITQKYHLYRSLYIAKNIKLNASGVYAKEKVYFGNTKRIIREMLAIVKDFILIKFDKTSKY